MASIPVQLFASLAATVGGAGQPASTASLSTPAAAADSSVVARVGCVGISNPNLSLTLAIEVDNGDGFGFVPGGPALNGIRPPVHNAGPPKGDGALATTYAVSGQLDPGNVGNPNRKVRLVVHAEASDGTLLVTFGAGTATLT